MVNRHTSAASAKPSGKPVHEWIDPASPESVLGKSQSNREVIQDEFLRMQKTLRKTILFVSHDIDEAVKMADRIAIFRAGKLAQFGPPDELLARPVDDFVASFVGRDRTLKRLRLIHVRDVMVPLSDGDDGSGPSVSAADDLRRVASLFLEHGVETIRCIDDTGRAIGQVSRAAVAARLRSEVR